jgi:ABC-type antimicrobial peptide transport system permease subunit
VARDVKSSSLVDGLAESFVYLPLPQHYTRDMTSAMTVAVRTNEGQKAIDRVRSAIASLDSKLPVVQSQTVEDSMALGIVPQRVAASLSGSLGMIGALLAGLGLYGVTTFTVARRRREIGVRMALGASGQDILRMVVGEGIWIVGTGSAIGLILAAAASRVLVAFFFGHPPTDPLPFAGGVALLALIGLLACYVPARGATKIDPLAVLRCE